MNNLTDVQRNLLVKTLNDLQIKSMLFDMDIDYETLSLTEKRVDETPIWLKRWQDKRREMDYDEYYDQRG